MKINSFPSVAYPSEAVSKPRTEQEGAEAQRKRLSGFDERTRTCSVQLRLLDCSAPLRLCVLLLNWPFQTVSVPFVQFHPQDE